MAGAVVDLGNIQIKACYTAGQSPATVFIHGGLGNRFNWRSQWEFLRSQGRTAIAYDLAGHGDSHQHRRYSVGRHRRDLSRLLKHYSIYAPVLCCHSYGVPIGLEWAARHPTSALILIGGGTHNLTPWWEIPLTRLVACGGYHFYRLQPVQQWMRRLVSAHSSDTVHRFFQESPLPQSSHPYQAMASFWGYDGRLKQIGCPVIVMTGERDPVFPPGMGEELTAHFKQQGLQTRHIMVPNAGHLVIAEAPDQVNQVLLDFEF